MHVHGHELVLSATDLSNFLGCRRRTGLDMAVAYGKLSRPYRDDPLLELLWQRGDEHEKRFVESLRAESSTIVDLGDLDDPVERVAMTLEEMAKGTDVIVQGGLSDDRWFGKPDVMRRVERPSALGDWSYEISDTKLARETRAGTILQLGLYSEMLATAQGLWPECFHVVTPDVTSPVHTYRVDDYAAYFRMVRGKMVETVALGHERVVIDNYPEPVEPCQICQWSTDCATKRRADDHLSLVAGITRTQRRELEARSIDTLTGLAGVPIPLTFKPKRGSAETYVRVREQARLQLESRGKNPPLHELLLPVEPEKGLCRLPAPTPGDLFLDLEGDEFAAEGGREYLFGLATADGGYESTWAFTDREERRGFEAVIDRITQAAREHPGMHVYHYAPYEPAAFKRLMGRYATRERELDAMLRAGRFIDLYAVVRQALRAGIERYSIKNLEPLYGFERVVSLTRANQSLREMEYGLESGTPESIPQEARQLVEGYNRDDCVSTLWLHRWLERVRADLVARGTDVPRPEWADGAAPASVDERAQRVDELRARLLSGVPEVRSERNEEQQGRWLLAYLLDYHRREDKASWWEYFRLCGLDEEMLFDERAAVGGLEFVERVGAVISKRTGKPTKSVIDRYRYPEQEMEIDIRDEVWLQDRKSFGKITNVDRVKRTFDVETGPSRIGIHPSAMFAFSRVASDAMENALLRLGESIVARRDGYGAARSLLAMTPPRLLSGSFDRGNDADVSEVDFAVRVSGLLDNTVLAIQGPPGSGKTFCGARMICELVAQGKRVGVTANSHSAIRTLLDAVIEQADSLGLAVSVAHKSGDEDEADAPRIKSLAENSDAVTALAAGDANVVGGTAWLWSRPELASAVDVLFVDEAGQMALANVLAISQAANSVVLLGDPRQLEQPRKGTHPEGVGLSALEHILAGRQTIPADAGIFLSETWRLAPRICDFTSELFYDGRLRSRPGLERQRISGVEGLPDSGLAFVGVDHDGNRNWSSDEIDVVASLVERLTSAGATWINAKGGESPIVGSNILVVAPYNAQVTRLTERLGSTGARVGTVDKFQGKEAPIVIYSMATSRPEDAPRGMEFLYSLNRLNVATSRAKCLAVLVASPRLLEPECRSPRQMQLANGLCRFRELATIMAASRPSPS